MASSLRVLDYSITSHQLGSKLQIYRQLEALEGLPILEREKYRALVSPEFSFIIY